MRPCAVAVAVATLFALAACEVPPARPPDPVPVLPAPPIAEPEPTPEPEAPPPAVSSRPAGVPVPVELYFHGMTPLHRGFFSDQDAVGQLGVDLGECLVDNAQIWVVWSETERIGHIYLKAVPGVLGACLPQMADDTLFVDALAPVGVALATYRDQIAAKYDFRVSSFRIGISATRGVNQCALWAAGSHPPDGRSWSPCVSLPDHDACSGPPREGRTRIKVPSADLAYVRACFRD